jgi:hypothetical protein
MRDRSQAMRMGFFVPAMPPLAPGPDPVIVAEMSLSQVPPFQHDTRVCGVGEVQGQVVADPQRGGQRFVYLSFGVAGGDYMVVRYRVTVYRPAH